MSASLLLCVTIPGEPVGKGRPRVTRSGHAYTPQKTRTWEGDAAATLALIWQGRAPLERPVQVIVHAVASRPQRLLRKKDPAHRLWRCTKPDGDNVLKAALDALVRAGVIRDDVLAVHAEVRSLYASRFEGPSVEIEVREVSPSLGATP